MGRIHQLPMSVVNRIAAGEVVERPASVVKELLENALDAAPARIDVALEQGGIGLVRVVDDGGGIEAADLPLAVTAHATSKLRVAEDLERIGTLGFRGEALASIGEVSRLVIRSRIPDGTGATITVDGGNVGEVMPDGCAVGTTVEVHQLFGNVPARMVPCLGCLRADGAGPSGCGPFALAQFVLGRQGPPRPRSSGHRCLADADR